MDLFWREGGEGEGEGLILLFSIGGFDGVFPLLRERGLSVLMRR